MKKRNKAHTDSFFHNEAEYFSNFKGKIISAEDIKQTDFSGLKVAIIGANQMSVSHLDVVCQNALFVKVFQMTPHFVLPHTEKGIQKIIAHPLIAKNKRLFNQRIKTTLAIRYLDSQISDTWLKRQLMPNPASSQKIFFKSDHYYSALQRENCKLITWPVVKITENAVQSMEGIEHLVDIIITTYEK